ncbi:MAG: zinc ribbon domain-containing protein [bacterium]|nr:zinc ribbon domain-containing protein [bacterium]
MPLYEYKCEGCNKVIEILQSSTVTQTEGYCPACNSVQQLSKQFSVPAAPQGHINPSFVKPATGHTCGHGGFG